MLSTNLQKSDIINNMTNISLSSILLFCLVTPFIMEHRIGPGETPYWLFTLIFLLLGSHLLLDVISIKESIRTNLKQVILWLSIIFILGATFISAIIVRHQTAPVYMIHDIILQQEAAIRYLIHGKNPYAATYFGTPMEAWNYSSTEINPALYHFVNQPLYLIFALPFYYISNHTIGYFDGRIPLLFLFFSVLILGGFLIKDKEKRSLFIILMAFNPAILSYTLEGRSDMFMFGFVFFSFYLLYKKHYFMGAIFMALAFGVKQSIWPILPLYFSFLWFNLKKLNVFIKNLVIFSITCAIVIGPFLIWDYKAFLNSTIFYLSGNTPHSYPISGYGLGKLLLSFGLIANESAYYSFQIWQFMLGLPTLAWLVIFLKKKPSVKRLIYVYGIFLFVFWYSARYFNNSHIGYLSVVFLTSYFWPEES